MERVKEQFGNHLQFYIDSSVLETGEVGCVLVIPDMKITIGVSNCPLEAAYFTAEL